MLLDNDSRGWIMAVVSGIGMSLARLLFFFFGFAVTDFGLSMHVWRYVRPGSLRIRVGLRVKWEAAP